MKKIYTVLFVCLCSLQLLSQEYVPMLANTNEWHLSTCFKGDCLKDIYYTAGDTVVDNMSFKVLDGYHYISRSFLMREDVEAQKVYLKTIVNGFVRDYLLYDFSLEEGDTFEMANPITPFPLDGGTFILEEKSMQPIANGDLAMHYYFTPSAENTSSTEDAIWIQGVGSLSIPNAPGGDPNFDGAGRLSCVFRDGILYYSDFTILDECEPTQLSLFDTETSFLLEFYTNETFIVVQNIEASWTWQLFDITGKKIGIDASLENGFLKIDKQKLPSGLYFIVIQNQTNQSQVLKISLR